MTAVGFDEKTQIESQEFTSQFARQVEGRKAPPQGSMGVFVTLMIAVMVITAWYGYGKEWTIAILILEVAFTYWNIRKGQKPTTILPENECYKLILPMIYWAQSQDPPLLPKGKVSFTEDSSNVRRFNADPKLKYFGFSIIEMVTDLTTYWFAKMDPYYGTFEGFITQDRNWTPLEKEFSDVEQQPSSETQTKRKEKMYEKTGRWSV